MSDWCAPLNEWMAIREFAGKEFLKCRLVLRQSCWTGIYDVTCWTGIYYVVCGVEPAGKVRQKVKDE